MTARPDKAVGVAVAMAETMPLATAVVTARSMASVMRAAREKKMSTRAWYAVVPMTMHPATFAARAGQMMRRAMFAVATAPTMPDVAGSPLFDKSNRPSAPVLRA